MTKNDKQLIKQLQNLPDDYWDFRNEDTKKFTHGIHGYPAMMVSPISRSIIEIVKNIFPVHTLLDPFSGSGTVLVEGMLSGIENVTGNDINPLALLISKVKTTPLNQEKLMFESDRTLQRIDIQRKSLFCVLETVDSYITDTIRLNIADKNGWGNEAHKYLEQYCKLHKADIEIPQFKNLGYWFRPRVILELSIIKTEIKKIQDKDIQDFMLIAFSECIKFVSNRRNGEFKMFRMPAKKLQAFMPNVYEEFKKILFRNIRKMKEFSDILNETKNHTKVFISKNNSSTLEDISDNAYNLIITSPPYGDSRTTVAYGEYCRLSLQWLDELPEKEIMSIDKSLMGGKRYKDGFNFSLLSPSLKESLQKIKNIDSKRAGDVYSFYVDLDASIKSIAKKTCSDGYQFWVVGNRTVKNETLHTDIIISELANQYGLTLVYNLGRSIPNKSMPPLNSPTNISGNTGHTMTKEHIVILRKN